MKRYFTENLPVNQILNYRTLILMLFILISIPGYSQVWSEDWENPDWSTKRTITNGTWEVGVPTSGPNATHGGNICMVTIAQKIK
jgi:hypothetical protein